MEPLVLSFAGLVLGTLCFAATARWAGLFFFAYLNLEVLDLPDRKARAFKLGLCQSPFHSGPWLLATVVYVGYHVRSESWFGAVFTGFVIGVFYMGVATWRAVKVMRLKRFTAE